MSMFDSLKNMFCVNRGSREPDLGSMSVEEKMKYFSDRFSSDVDPFQSSVEMAVFDLMVASGLFGASSAPVFPRINDQGFFDIFYARVMNSPGMIEYRKRNKSTFMVYIAREFFFLGVVSVMQEVQSGCRISDLPPSNFNYIVNNIAELSPSNAILSDRDEAFVRRISSITSQVPSVLYDRYQRDLKDSVRYRLFVRAFYVVGQFYGLELYDDVSGSSDE